MRRGTVVAVLTAALLGLTGCGEPVSSSATHHASSAATPDKSASAVTIRVEVKAGKVISGGGKHPVALHSDLVLEIVSDKADEVHIHGYDKEAEVAAGKPTRIEFTANIPGEFEVELHHSEVELCELQVQ